MIQQFLKAKHWQLFLLIFGLPLIYQIILMLSMTTFTNEDQDADISSLMNVLMFYPIVFVIVTAALYAWYWSIAIGLQDQVPMHSKMNTRRFKMFFNIQIALFLIILILMIIVYNGYYSEVFINKQFFIGAFIVMIPIVLFSLVAVFYMMYFAAKTFKTVELQKEVRFSEFAGEFLMIWFYFVGFWILQPKLNKMAENQSTTKTFL